jgi:hypothetical protein
MSKILEKDFRNDLYKNLCEAGYDKTEAQKIISVKYREALKVMLIDKLKAQIVNIENDKEELLITVDELNNGLTELQKLKEFFNKLEKSS